MKSTTHFKETIKKYLDDRANQDEVFAEKYANENKNLDDCITYILNTVKKSGCNGFADDEIYGMAIHYYDEESIDVGEEVKCRVAVNHIVELSEDDKRAAKEKAMRELVDENKEKLKNKKQAKKQAEETMQATLF